MRPARSFDSAFPFLKALPQRPGQARNSNHFPRPASPSNAVASLPGRTRQVLMPVYYSVVTVQPDGTPFTPVTSQVAALLFTKVPEEATLLTQFFV